MARRPRPNYRERDVRALIEEYGAFRAKASTAVSWHDTSRGPLNVLVMLADLDRALHTLSRKYWEVVLLHGLIGLSQEQTAKTLHISQQAVGKRYRQGLNEVLYSINGGVL